MYMYIYIYVYTCLYLCLLTCVTRMKVSPMILRLSSGRVSTSSGSDTSPFTSVTARAKSSVASSASIGRPSEASAVTTSRLSSCRRIQGGSD